MTDKLTVTLDIPLHQIRAQVAATLRQALDGRGCGGDSLAVGVQRETARQLEAIDWVEAVRLCLASELPRLLGETVGEAVRKLLKNEIRRLKDTGVLAHMVREATPQPTPNNTLFSEPESGG